MEAAPVQIVQVKPEPGRKSSEFLGGVVTADVLGVLGAVTDFLPVGLRWVPLAIAGLVKVAYVISRGIAKRPVVAAPTR